MVVDSLMGAHVARFGQVGREIRRLVARLATGIDRGPVDGLVDLRSEALRLATLGLLGIGLIVVAVGVVREPEIRYLLVAPLVVGYTTFRFGGRHFRFAALVLVGSVFGTVTAYSAALHASSFVFLYGPFVVLTALMLGWRYSLGLALAATAACLGGSVLSAPLPTEILTTALASIWICAGIAWIALAPVYTALRWSWQHHVASQRLIDELRVNQGELSRALKDRDVACQRLEELTRELNAARASAERAQRLKSEFATNLSHELRTPVNLIVGFSELMVIEAEQSYGASLPEPYRADLEAIYRNACHISGLIDDILDLARVDAYRVGLQREPTSMATIVDEALGVVSRLFRDKRLQISAHLPPDAPLVHVDRTRLRQVLINLLCNAARFIDEGGVRIEGRWTETDFVVSVHDTGQGMAPEEVPHLFDEFYHTRPDLRASIGGAGVGLAISKRFVELHGGNIWVESTPGVGTTFSFSIPLQKDVIPTPLPSQLDRRIRARPNGAAPSVAVIGPPHVQSVFARYFDGFRVVAPRDGAAIRPAEEGTHGSPVAVILPAADVTPLGAPDLGLSPRCPIVRYTLEEIQAGERDLPVRDFLTKPISRRRLEAAIRGLSRPIRTILVVDDDPEMTRLIARMLRAIDHRYEVTRVHSGVEALELLRRAAPDLVLLDLVMPRMNGYRLLDELGRQTGGVELPVIAISAWDRPQESVLIREISFSRLGGMSLGDALACLGDGLRALIADWEGDTPRSPREGRRASPALAGTLAPRARPRGPARG